MSRHRGARRNSITRSTAHVRTQALSRTAENHPTCPPRSLHATRTDDDAFRSHGSTLSSGTIGSSAACTMSVGTSMSVSPGHSSRSRSSRGHRRSRASAPRRLRRRPARFASGGAPPSRRSRDSGACARTPAPGERARGARTRGTGACATVRAHATSPRDERGRDRRHRAKVRRRATPQLTGQPQRDVPAEREAEESHVSHVLPSGDVCQRGARILDEPSVIQRCYVRNRFARAAQVQANDVKACPVKRQGRADHVIRLRRASHAMHEHDRCPFAMRVPRRGGVQLSPGARKRDPQRLERHLRARPEGQRGAKSLHVLVPEPARRNESLGHPFIVSACDSGNRRILPCDLKSLSNELRFARPWTQH